MKKSKTRASTARNIKAKESCKLCHKNLLALRMNVHYDKKHKADVNFLLNGISDADLKFSCNICEDKFVSENSLRLHNQIHVYKMNTRYEYKKKDQLQNY